MLEDLIKDFKIKIWIKEEMIEIKEDNIEDRKEKMIEEIKVDMLIEEDRVEEGEEGEEDKIEEIKVKILT